MTITIDLESAAATAFECAMAMKEFSIHYQRSSNLFYDFLVNDGEAIGGRIRETALRHAVANHQLIDIRGLGDSFIKNRAPDQSMDDFRFHWVVGKVIEQAKSYMMEMGQLVEHGAIKETSAAPIKTKSPTAKVDVPYSLGIKM